jgi:hypothetical protein
MPCDVALPRASIIHWRSRVCSTWQMVCCNPLAQEPKATAVQYMPSDSKQITTIMTYTRSSKKQSPAATIQVPAQVQKKAVNQEKSGSRTQLAKPAVATVACTLNPVKQASAATVTTPKTGKPVAPKLIKAAAADKKVYGANGKCKPAAAAGGKVSPAIKKTQGVKASGAKAITAKARKDRK